VSSDYVPIPVGWKVIIEPKQGVTVTEAGIDISVTVESQEHLIYLGKIVAMGEAAFMASTKGGIDMSKWERRPQVGDYVIYSPYGGIRIRRTERDGKKRPILLLFNDTDIHAIIDDPDKYFSWVDA